MLLLFTFLISFYSQADIINRGIGPLDDPSSMSKDSKIEHNLYVLDSTTALEVNLSLQPWADRFWQFQDGIISSRYADPNFNTLKSFQEKHDYVLTNSVQKMNSVPDEQKADALDLLSPAEKYDLLVGDDKMSLSEAQWKAAEKSEKTGTLSDWNGICEGTAAASSYFPEPQHAIDLKTSNGKMIRFHVLDIKALESLLWSSFNLYIPIVGSRCRTKNPAHDENGIVTDQSCFDVNPGPWHMALLNFLGRKKQVFFINRSNEAEVWNVPVLSYKIKYFRPNDVLSSSSGKLSDSIIPIKDYDKDKFHALRAKNIDSIVGVSVSVDLATGYTNNRDRPAKAAISSLIFTYDLELDSKGEILGGEWLTEKHPDFMWAVSTAGFVPRSVGDLKLSGQTWADGPVPSSWLDAVRLSSQKNQPLELVVRKLVEFSQQ